MTSHPFTDEDIEAAAASVLASPTYIKRVARYLWESAVARGAVQTYDSSMELPTPHATRKLPKDKP